MLNRHCARPARLDSSIRPGLPPRLETSADRERAPITSGWWAYGPSGESRLQRFHLETLNRLDRVDGGLQPNAYYGQSAEQLRAQLREQQQHLLPTLPAGYRWLGPQLVEDVCTAVLRLPAGAGKSASTSATCRNHTVLEAA